MLDRKSQVIDSFGLGYFPNEWVCYGSNLGMSQKQTYYGFPRLPMLAWNCNSVTRRFHSSQAAEPIQVDVASVTRLIYLCQAVPSNRISSQRLESDSFTAATSSRESSCDRHVPAAGRTRARHLSISFYRMPPSHDLNIEQHDILVFFTTSSRKPPLKSFQEARIRINRTLNSCCLHQAKSD